MQPGLVASQRLAARVCGLLGHATGSGHKSKLNFVVSIFPAGSSMAMHFAYEYFCTRWNMKKLVQFIKDSIAELRKVVWPSKEDAISSVKVVIISTIVVALFLGLIDFLCVRGIDLIL